MAKSSITVRLKEEFSVAEDAQVRPYKDQSYRELKNKCTQERALFEDPEFEACPESLGYNELRPGSHKTKGVIWKRPKDICDSPCFIRDGMYRMDVIQHGLSDCWFMAAAATLTLKPQLLSRVVPKDQSFDDADYAGIFHFQFWQYGEWVDVVVDDLLPMKNNQLMFASSHIHKFHNNGYARDNPTQDEFWMPLLEKAYAKLHGSYEAIEFGPMTEALVDFTGGIGKFMEVKERSERDIFKKIEEEAEKNSLMGAGINGVRKEEKKALQGLGDNHAYSIIKTEKFTLRDKKVRLVRLYNPWGGNNEWRGDWGDNSDKWKMLDGTMLDSINKKKLHVKDDDGEFWMELKDFIRCFDGLFICQLSSSFPWNSCLHGRWVKGHSAGGSQKDLFWINPQYHVELLGSDEEQLKKQLRHGHMESNCKLVVSLMQKDMRIKKSLGEKIPSIGFQIFEMPEKYLQMNTAQRIESLLKLKLLDQCYEVELRDVTVSYSLSPGDYLIIPSTNETSVEVDFTLRIFTDKKHKFSEIDEKIKAEGWILKEPTLLMSGQEQKLEEIFSHYAGPDHQVDPAKLWIILNQIITDVISLKMDSLSLEEAKKLIQNYSGSSKMTLPVFQQFYSKMMEWEHIFKKYAIKWTDKMNIHDMQFALELGGFRLNRQTRELVVKNDGKPWFLIDFKRFVFIMVHLESVFRLCKSYDSSGCGEVFMTKKEWKELVECCYPCLQEADLIHPHFPIIHGRLYSNPLYQAH